MGVKRNFIKAGDPTTPWWCSPRPSTERWVEMAGKFPKGSDIWSPTIV